jgi:hypothetical protein
LLIAAARLHRKTRWPRCRTGNGRGAAAELDYVSIARLDAGLWFDARFAGDHTRAR